MKSYKYYMEIAKEIFDIAEKTEHNMDIDVSYYHTSSTGTPFVTIAVSHEGRYVHFYFYDFHTKAKHKEMLFAFETYLKTGEVVEPAYSGSAKFHQTDK